MGKADEKAAAADAKQSADPETTKGPADAADAEPKQGVITSADTRGAGPKRLKVAGFRGSFKDAVFNDDGESEKPVSEETAIALKTQFKDATIEEIE
jgi:hypothetical protein